MIRPNDEDILPRVIPPKSVVRLVRTSPNTPLWRDQIGRVFRVGYYCQGDGTDTIWLVNDDGEYEQTTDRASFAEHFEVVTLSREQQWFGEGKPRLGPRKPTAAARPRSGSST